MEAIVREALCERVCVREGSAGVFVIPHREQHGLTQPWRSLARQRNSWCDVKPSQAGNVDWCRSAPERPKRGKDAGVGDVDRGDHRTIIDRRGACGQSRLGRNRVAVWPPRTAHSARREARRAAPLVDPNRSADRRSRKHAESGNLVRRVGSARSGFENARRADLSGLLGAVGERSARAFCVRLWAVAAAGAGRGRTGLRGVPGPVSLSPEKGGSDTGVRRIDGSARGANASGQLPVAVGEPITEHLRQRIAS